MPDKMEKTLFQLDTSLLAAMGYFGNHTSNAARQDIDFCQGYSLMGV